MVTTTLKGPAVWPVIPVTVSELAVAEVTVPVPEGVKTTVLLLAVASKPVPLITKLEAVAAMVAVLLVTTGATAAPKKRTIARLPPPPVIPASTMFPSLCTAML